MKHKIICCLALVIALISNAQNKATEIEYFFDTDPGIGKAIKINVTDVAKLNEKLTIPINDLSVGIHNLHIRTKNNLNKWSLYSRQNFYIANFSSSLSNTVTEAEYFFDTDPGIGNAEKLSVSDAKTVNKTFVIPITGVSDGIHILHIRTKNNLNQWSLYGRQVFYKSAKISDNEIVAAEFFIDIDPGVGNATALALSQSAMVDETLSIPIPNDLPAGNHILHIRVKSSNGNWSLYGKPEFTSKLSNEDFVLKNFKIYPNPVEDILYFSIQNNTIENVKLVDITGKIVKETSGNLSSLNVSSLPTGFYLLQIKTIEGSISKKIIKK